MKTKRVLWGFFSLDYKAMEDYLEQMAKKGWMPEKIGPYIAKFRAIEPQKLKFYVDVFKKGGTLTPENNEELVEYRKLCLESGWTFITSHEYLQFFYADGGNEPVPIQTDEEIEHKIVEHTLLRRELSGIFIVLIISIFVLISNLPINYNNLLSFVGVTGTFLFPILFIFTAITAVYSIIWTVTARRNIINGLPITKPTLKGARRRIIIFNGSTWIIALTFVLAFIADAFFKPDVILMLLGPLLGALIGSGLRSLVKKNKIKKDNIVLYLVITLLISIILMYTIDSFIRKRSEDIYKTDSIPDNYPIITLEEITKESSQGSALRKFKPGMSPIVPKHYTYWKYENIDDANAKGISIRYYEAINPYFAKIIFHGITEELEKETKWRGMTFFARNTIQDDEMKNLWDVDNMILTEQRDLIIIQKGNIVLSFGGFSGVTDFNDKHTRELLLSRFFPDASLEN